MGRKMYRVQLYLSQYALMHMDSIPSATHRFTAPLPEILAMCGAEGQNAAAKKYLNDMLETKVTFDSPDSKSELQHKAYHLLSEVSLHLRGGVLWVYWSLPPTLYEALVDPERWGNIDLRILSRMTTYASVALYEICSKYQDNPSKVTCRKSPDWWMEVLSGTPASIDEETGKPKLPEWRKFKNKTLIPAIKVMNEDSDLNIELLEDRLYGKAVTSVQFRVTRKPEAKSSKDGPPLSEHVDAYAARIGLTEKFALKKLAQIHGDEAMMKGLAKLHARMEQTELSFVARPVGLLRTYLDAFRAEELLDKQEQGKRGSQNEPPRSRVTERGEGYVSDMERTEEAAAGREALRQIERQEAWVKAKREEISQKLMQMEQQELQHWIDAYSKSLESKGQLTLAVKRRLAQPDWFTGMARAGMIEFYAKSEIGDDWKSLYVLDDTGE